jgi:hypothetical protein
VTRSAAMAVIEVVSKATSSSVRMVVPVQGEPAC